MTCTWRIPAAGIYPLLAVYVQQFCLLTHYASFKKVCPFRGLPTAAPVSVSQIRIIVSSDPEIMYRPVIKRGMNHRELLIGEHGEWH